MTENRKLKIFLCHSKDDKPKVRELYYRLVAHGFDAWLDEEKLMPGQDWDLEIRKAVRESDAVVVCLSNGSVTKAGYVQKEIRFALDIADEQPEGAIFIVPARLEECATPIRLSKWQWVNLFEEKGYKQLIASLNQRGSELGIVSYLSFDSMPPMVYIPAGKFLMGTREEQAQSAIKLGRAKARLEEEQPQHTVELSEYFIGKYPITNREYQAFVQDAKYRPPPDWVGNQFPAEKGGYPVIYVNWHDARAYCRWLSERTGKPYSLPYRLPSEAEWEKASRGVDGRIWPWGNEFGENNANTAEAEIGGTSEVGKFSPQGDSPYGCSDMAGNVSEWTTSLWGKYQHSPDFKYPYNAKDGRENYDASLNILRVLRGGTFEDDLRFARCASRNISLPHYAYNAWGFRVVFSPSK